MAAKRAKGPKVRTVMSVGQAQAKRLERIAKAFMASVPGLRITRAEALRAVVNVGLDAMERKLRRKRTRRP